ncbi:hypothetical protein M2132_001536 [Dysgonomonas sp. PH5-45]|nr:hypothetical protein [Dysgonomonas sp. PH5-45]MDH6388075.1 hypothetical protein [Dysgonomonas sp. PH5-37]
MKGQMTIIYNIALAVRKIGWYCNLAKGVMFTKITTNTIAFFDYAKNKGGIPSFFCEKFCS